MDRDGGRSGVSRFAAEAGARGADADADADGGGGGKRRRTTCAPRVVERENAFRVGRAAAAAVVVDADGDGDGDDVDDDAEDLYRAVDEDGRGAVATRDLVAALEARPEMARRLRGVRGGEGGGRSRGEGGGADAWRRCLGGDDDRELTLAQFVKLFAREEAEKDGGGAARGRRARGGEGGATTTTTTTTTTRAPKPTPKRGPFPHGILKENVAASERTTSGKRKRGVFGGSNRRDRPSPGEVRSIHWFPYDPVRVVNADP